jgi:signal transduction histidine kinase
MTTDIHRRTRRIFVWLAAVPVLLGVFAFWTAAEYRNRILWVSHTGYVLDRISDLLLEVSRAESGQRGYLLTGDPAFLVPMRESSAKATEDVTDLRHLTADNTVQQKQAEELESLVRARVLLLENVADKYDRKELPDGDVKSLLQNGRAVYDKITSITRAMSVEEERLLAERQRAQVTMEIYTVIAFSSGFAVCLALLIWAQRLLSRYAHERDFAEASSLELNEELLQQIERTNDLNQVLQESMAEIHRLNSDLERRVNERTAELQKTNQQLMRSNEDLSRFAHIASHDLQEPLRMIGSYAGLVLRRYDGTLDDRGKKYLGYLVDGAKRMQTLVHDLLVYSRAGTQALRRELVSLENVLLHARQNLHVAIVEAKAEITHKGLPELDADASKLLQVFQNLLSNAIKFRKPHETARIHICAGREGPMWLITVKDNGIGFEQQFADRIFLPFQRLHELGAYPGTGIGLAICKRVVEAHGGRIWAESQPGAGAAFHLTLPATDAPVERDTTVEVRQQTGVPENQNA